MSEDAWEQIAPLDKRELREDHEAVLVEESGISEEIVAGRGYYSPTRLQVKAFIDAGLYVKGALQAKSWIGMPMFRPDGVKHGEVLRLMGGTGKMKYTFPIGRRNCLDIHPDKIADVLDPSVPLIFTEGVKKADSLLSAAIAEGTRYVTVGVNGVQGWKAKTDGGGSIALPDFMDIPLAGRKVYVISDSDYRTNNQVRRGWSDCATYLSSKTGEGKSLLVVVPPAGVDKQGADDYLAGGGTLADLLGYASTPDQALRDAPLDAVVPLEVRSGLTILHSALDKIPHIITPMLPEQAIMVMAGQSGSLKTWHALALILDGAFGKRWIDHPDMQQDETPWKSIYINKEMGGAVFSNRLAGLARNPRYRDVPNWEKFMDANIFSPEKLASFDLISPNSREALEMVIQEQGIKVVILDSLSMCWSGDEDSNSQVGLLYSQLREITERTRASWVIIHHTLKPSGTRKKDPLMFSIRGAGQIVQQSDTAILLSPSTEQSTDPSSSEVTVAFVKTRTDKEPPTFLSRLEDHDGLYMSLTYVDTVSVARAGQYAASRGDHRKLQLWVMAELPSMPALRPSGPGMRMPQLLPLLRMQWPAEDKSPPSEASLRRAVLELHAAGQLEMLEENKRLGDSFRLSDVEVDLDPPQYVEPSTVVEAATKKRGRPAKKPDYTAVNEYVKLETTGKPGRRKKKS